MNTPSESAGAGVDPPGIAPAAMTTRPLYWSVRREFWESRSITIAPLAVAAIVLLGSLISVIVSASRLEASQLSAFVRPVKMAPAAIMLAAFLVGVFYSLEALYGERRDRSILFWKSLPVSDLTTVLSKASIPLAMLPLLAFLLSVATQTCLLVVCSVILMGSGVSAPGLWAEVEFFQGLLVMVYGLTVHVLWFAPIYGWLLLVSSWARRTPILWAGLPPLGIALLERIAFGSSSLASLLRYRVTGAMTEAFVAEVQHGDVDRLSQLDPAGFLGSAGLWMGLAFAASSLAAAARIRRYREPI